MRDRSSAFTQTHVRVTFDIPADEVDPAEPAAGNFRASVQDSLVRLVPGAEAADHHPDILIHGPNKVRLTLSSHDTGGLTEREHDLARRIDAVVDG